MKKEFKGNGKGKRPIVGYNAKNWNANFDFINWNKTLDTKQWCAWCGKWGNHTSGSCSDLKKQTKQIERQNNKL